MSNSCNKIIEYIKRIQPIPNRLFSFFNHKLNFSQSRKSRYRSVGFPTNKNELNLNQKNKVELFYKIVLTNKIIGGIIRYTKKQEENKMDTYGYIFDMVGDAIIDGILTDVSYDGISDYLEYNGIFCSGSLLLDLESKYCR